MPLRLLESEVAALVELHVRDDLAAVLGMTERTVQDYMASLAPDRVAWASMLATIAGATNGSAGFTVAGGIGVLSTLPNNGASVQWQAH